MGIQLVHLCFLVNICNVKLFLSYKVAKKSCALFMAVLKESISTSTAAPIPADVDPSSVSFDKNTFCRKLNITALSVPAQLCSTLIEKLRGRLIGGRKLRCVVDDPQKRKDRKLILLDVGITMDNLPQSAKAILNAQGAAIEVVHDYPVTVDHSHFSVGFAFVVAIFYMVQITFSAKFCHPQLLKFHLHSKLLVFKHNVLLID